MWTGKHLHYRQTEENWLYQRWLVLLPLQHYVRSNGLLLPFLSLSGRLVELKDIFNKTGVIAMCSRETMHTKWRLCKLTNLTVFAALVNVMPTGCTDAVLPELLLRNCTINCLTSGKKTKQTQIDNLCLFRAVALNLQENHWLAEENLEIFTSSVKRMDGLSPSQFKGVHMNDLPVAEDLLTLNNLLYDLDIVGWNNLVELVGRSAQKYESTAGLLRYNDRICYVRNTNAVFRPSVPRVVTLSSSEHSTWNGT